MPPFCFWTKKKPQAFCESLRLCRLLDIQFFVFPHSISITTETVMWFSMRLLRSLSPSPSNTTWRENNVKRMISTRFLFVAKLSLPHVQYWGYLLQEFSDLSHFPAHFQHIKTEKPTICTAFLTVNRGFSLVRSRELESLALWLKESKVHHS